MLILQKNAALKTSVCSCENRAPQTGPCPSPSHRRLAGRLLNSSVVFCLARRTHNYQTKGRTHHSLCTKALFNTESSLKVRSGSACVGECPGYLVAQVTSPRVHRWTPPAAPTGSAAAG